MKKLMSILAISGVLSVMQCSVVEQVGERLSILMVQFSSEGTAVSLKSPAQISIFPSDYGFDLAWKIKASNPNNNTAAFDGADLALRIIDVSSTADSFPGVIPAFKVRGNTDTVITVNIPVTLDKWKMGYGALQKVVTGDKIPYRLSANLFFNLISETGTSLDTLGNRTVPLNLVTDSLSTRPSQAQTQLFLSLVNQFMK